MLYRDSNQLGLMHCVTMCPSLWLQYIGGVQRNYTITINAESGIYNFTSIMITTKHGMYT